MLGYRHDGSQVAVAQERWQAGHVEVSNVYPRPRGNAVESVLRLAFKARRDMKSDNDMSKECQQRVLNINGKIIAHGRLG